MPMGDQYEVASVSVCDTPLSSLLAELLLDAMEDGSSQLCADDGAAP